MWVPVPASWAKSIVVGRGYSANENDGAVLWNAVIERTTLAPSVPYEAPRYGSPTLMRPRLGQGAFRVLVTDAYERRCAASGEKTLPILDAAHIQSYGAGGEHQATNGLLLRTDIHKLFDLGYVTIDEDRRLVVSGCLKPISTMASITTTCTVRP
jgi:putative restriction endonuclease